MRPAAEIKKESIEQFPVLKAVNTTCKNCGEMVAKKYCGNCGQNRDVHRIELAHLVHDIPHAIFHVDSGFFFNVIQLFKRPGPAIRDFIEGRRKAFFHPVTYLAILLVFNLFAVKITNLHYYDQKELLSMSSEQIAFIKEYDKTQWWFLEHTYLYMLIAIPACTTFSYFILRLYKKKYNFAENAVIIMFTIAQGVLIQSVIYLLTGWIRNGVFIRTMEIINLTFLFLYAAYVMYQLVNPSRRKLATAISMTVCGFLILLIMLCSAYFLLELSYLAS